MSAYHEGKKARTEGKSISNNPYNHTGHKDDWRKGWHDQDRIIDSLSPHPIQELIDRGFELK